MTAAAFDAFAARKTRQAERAAIHRLATIRGAVEPFRGPDPAAPFVFEHLRVRGAHA